MEAWQHLLQNCEGLGGLDRIKAADPRDVAAGMLHAGGKSHFDDRGRAWYHREDNRYSRASLLRGTKRQGA